MKEGKGSSPGGSRGHVAALDGVRGLAIVMVLFVHLLGDLESRSSFEHLILKLSNYGLWGVDLFFVLSGFLITGILWDTKGAAHYFQNFYARRTLRIFPLYYGVLFLLFVVWPLVVPGLYPVPLAVTATHQAWLWSYGTNIYLWMKDAWALPYVGHFWSLAVEEHFYLFWPLIVFSCSRRTLLRVCVLLVASSLGLRWLMAARGMGEVALQVLTPYRLDSLCIGAYLAVGSRSDQPGEKASLLPFARWARPLLYGTFTLTVLLSFWHQRTLLFDAFTLPLRRTVIDFFFAALLVRVLTLDEGTVLVRFFSSAAMRMLGRYSYGLYVFHGIIAYGLVEVQADASWLTARLGSHVLAMFVQGLLGGLVSLAVAVASYELFEKRFLRLKERFASRAEKPAKLTREHLRDPEIERQEVDNVTR